MILQVNKFDLLHQIVVLKNKVNNLTFLDCRWCGISHRSWALVCDVINCNIKLIMHNMYRFMIDVVMIEQLDGSLVNNGNKRTCHTKYACYRHMVIVITLHMRMPIRNGSETYKIWLFLMKIVRFIKKIQNYQYHQLS